MHKLAIPAGAAALASAGHAAMKALQARVQEKALTEGAARRATAA